MLFELFYFSFIQYFLRNFFSFQNRLSYPYLIRNVVNRNSFLNRKFSYLSDPYPLSNIIIFLAMLANLVVLLSSFLIYNHNGPEYTVEKTIGKLQIRNYQPWIVAETVVKATHENAANEAFHILAGYIFGDNDQNVKIEMTAPVTQQEISEGEYLVQFFMPKGWTLDSLPKPNNSRVNLRMIPQRRLAALRYNGGWSEGVYNEEVLKTEGDLEKTGIEAKGEPIWARYNSPMAPSFLRTNEIVFEI